MTPERLAEIEQKAAQAWQGAHWINLQVRRNARDEVQEGDWVRYAVQELLTALREAQKCIAKQGEEI